MADHHPVIQSWPARVSPAARSTAPQPPGRIAAPPTDRSADRAHLRTPNGCAPRQRPPQTAEEAIQAEQGADRGPQPCAHPDQHANLVYYDALFSPPVFYQTRLLLLAMSATEITTIALWTLFCSIRGRVDSSIFVMGCKKERHDRFLTP